MRIISALMSAIRHIRTEVFKLKQAEFAVAIGVSQSTVSRWEKGVAPSLTEMQAIRSAAVERGYDWNDALFFEAPPASIEGDAA
ncbi:helix-turn-helix transcriptional regulator [Mesorhizobium sp. Z1-4]|uniref:helix-turn-helix transcriptional regulator n=1 Tax=Mesorhizobium sp. Z1-4 TaxID=2448478 RepID=UPI000FDC210B|nr:helix-turn-helix transcriptional regulator [Mesorhizobium sp. Z1-4]